MEIEKVTYALAAIVESARQIHQIARNGIIDERIVGCLLRGVLRVEPESTESVYPKSCLTGGLNYLADVTQLDPKEAHDITRYMFSFFKLTEKYLTEAEARESLGTQITYIRKSLMDQVEKSTFTAKQLSSWYKTNIFDRQIHQIPIYGDKQYLTVERNVNFIRALIVSGIRACILWKQVGGTQLNCFFNKSRISICAKDFLSKLIQEQ